MMQTAAVTTVMRALADPTRRAVFERLASSDEITVSELTRGSGVTQGAVSQHLRALKEAGLVADRPAGRNIYYRMQPSGMAPLVDWMSRYERFWTARLDHLERLLREEAASTTPPKAPKSEGEDQ